MKVTIDGIITQANMSKKGDRIYLEILEPNGNGNTSQYNVSLVDVPMTKIAPYVMQRVTIKAEMTGRVFQNSDANGNVRSSQVLSFSTFEVGIPSSKAS